VRIIVPREAIVGSTLRRPAQFPRACLNSPVANDDPIDTVEVSHQRRSARAALLAAPTLVAFVLGVVLLVGGSTNGNIAQSPPPYATTPDVASPVFVRLLQIADAAAQANGGTAAHVQAVLSRRGVAEKYMSGAIVGGTDAVWEVQIVGDREFVCSGCSRPLGGHSPTGRVLQLSVRADNFQTEDFGIVDQVKDLSSLGNVFDLR
jgi:hypothetical protein